MWKHKSEAVLNIETSKNRELRKMSILKHSRYRTICTARSPRYFTPHEIPRFSVESLFNMPTDIIDTLDSTKSTKRFDSYPSKPKPKTSTMYSDRGSVSSKSPQVLKPSYILRKKSIKTPRSSALKPKASTMPHSPFMLEPLGSPFNHLSHINITESSISCHKLHNNSFASSKSAVTNSSVGYSGYWSTPKLRPQLKYNS